MIGKSRERCRPRSAGPEMARGREQQRAGKSGSHGEGKAEYGKGPGAALSTWSASCQGESLKDTWDILTVWTANPGPSKAPGSARSYVFSRWWPVYMFDSCIAYVICYGFSCWASAHR